VVIAPAAWPRPFRVVMVPSAGSSHGAWPARSAAMAAVIANDEERIEGKEHAWAEAPADNPPDPDVETLAGKAFLQNVDEIGKREEP